VTLLPAQSRLRKALGVAGAEFFLHGIGALSRLLPHVQTTGWQIVEGSYTPPSANYVNATKRQLRLVLGLHLAADWTVTGLLERRRLPPGTVGAISRTVDKVERSLATQVLRTIESILGPPITAHSRSLGALRQSFDERVVADYLSATYRLPENFASWLDEMRRLAEQSYENKSLSFGCVIEAERDTQPVLGAHFPIDYLKRKRYRALSDGYHTAYFLSRHGALLGFRALTGLIPTGHKYYPDWCEDLASHTRDGSLALALTRQGDMLVLERGGLTFTYRFGQWQFWNHSHIVDLIRNAARVQKVPPARLSGVVRVMYRGALDVSFRRSGGLFVLLRRQADLRHVVPRGEAVDDPTRDSLDEGFDTTLGGGRAETLQRPVIAELAGLDGALVLSNTGKVLAYGAILAPSRNGRIAGTEGSRTKAAIGASKYGLALKVSSDGEIIVYLKGAQLLRV
jgi:hypothetical protein